MRTYTSPNPQMCTGSLGITGASGNQCLWMHTALPPSGPTIYLWLQMIAAWLAMRFARLAVRMVRCDMVFTTRPCLGHLRSAHGMLAKLSASEINALWKPYRRSRCEVQVIQFAGFISHPALSACPDEISSAIDHRCAAKSNFAGHAGQACLLLQIERFDM